MTTSIPIRSGALLGAALLAASALTACGGGSSSDGQPQAQDSTAVPASAGASAQAFITFQQGLDASESADSLSLGDFLPPKDDTAEPNPVG